MVNSQWLGLYFVVSGLIVVSMGTLLLCSPPKRLNLGIVEHFDAPRVSGGSGGTEVTVMGGDGGAGVSFGPSLHLGGHGAALRRPCENLGSKGNAQVIIIECFDGEIME